MASSDRVLSITDTSFEREVLQSDTPVLLDFGAEWCSPCKALAPIVDGLADEYAGKLKVAKIDIDHSPDVASRYGIRGVPTVIVFKGGAEVARSQGLVPKAKLVSLVAPHL